MSTLTSLCVAFGRTELLRAKGLLSKTPVHWIDVDDDPAVCSCRYNQSNPHDYDLAYRNLITYLITRFGVTFSVKQECCRKDSKGQAYFTTVVEFGLHSNGSVDPAELVYHTATTNAFVNLLC